MAGELFFFIAVIWLVLAIGTAADASKRGGNAFVWFLVVAFTGILGLLAYAIANMNHTQNQSQSSLVLEVSGTVEDEDGEETQVMLPVQTDSVDTAVTRFKAKCMDNGYRVKGQPQVEIRD